MWMVEVVVVDDDDDKFTMFAIQLQLDSWTRWLAD